MSLGIRVLPGVGALGADFDYTDTGVIRTFTLKNNFSTNTFDRKDIKHSNNDKQVVIDGNNKTVTITDVSFNGLFFVGNEYVGNNKPTIIKNFKIKSSVDIQVGLAKVTGYVKFENCHLELNGNINYLGGGLANNSDGDNNNTKIEFNNCSVKVFGKIGGNAGSLIGYMALNSGNVYNITNCYTVVSDNNSLTGDKTLGQSSGAFVGSGISENVTITNSYCLFNGSMHYGSGIIAGKFLGSNSTLTINKFYAVTNITSIEPSTAIPPALPGPDQVAYLLSSYHGSSPPTSFILSNVNILNLNLLTPLTNIYNSDNSTIQTSLASFNVHTTYSAFAAIANTSNNRVGNKTFRIIINTDDRIFYTYSASSPNFKFNLTNGTLEIYIEIKKKKSKTSATTRNIQLYNNYRAYRFNGNVAWIVYRNWWRRWG